MTRLTLALPCGLLLEHNHTHPSAAGETPEARAEWPAPGRQLSTQKEGVQYYMCFEDQQELASFPTTSAPASLPQPAARRPHNLADLSGHKGDPYYLPSPRLPCPPPPTDPGRSGRVLPATTSAMIPTSGCPFLPFRPAAVPAAHRPLVPRRCPVLTSLHAVGTQHQASR